MVKRKSLKPICSAFHHRSARTKNHGHGPACYGIPTVGRRTTISPAHFCGTSIVRWTISQHNVSYILSGGNCSLVCAVCSESSGGAGTKEKMVLYKKVPKFQKTDIGGNLRKGRGQLCWNEYSIYWQDTCYANMSDYVETHIMEKSGTYTTATTLN